ncbi:MAG: AbrB/MazE/SpoVT family DNA-binding domain-containing protein [Deltaproteobacteria bacterium]|nr:AbrB/MazE/SpoVT family DNA-binding domain-containing protein [Deltaproteobacteria bacterium]
MRTAKLFKNGQSQAVRLPKEFRFKGNKVYIRRLGPNVVLIPEDIDPWKAMFESTSKFTPDYMEEREQGPALF